MDLIGLAREARRVEVDDDDVAAEDEDGPAASGLEVELANLASRRVDVDVEAVGVREESDPS